jgi:hypothetical protein
VSRRLLIVLGVLAAAAVALLLIGGVVGGGGDDNEPPGARRAVIDEHAGSYRDVEIGDAEDDVRRIFGEPGEGDGFFPLGESFGEIGGAPGVRNWPPDWRGRPALLRYDNVAFLVGLRGVFAFVVTEDEARTMRGVKIGDPLKRARAVYGGGCGKQQYGESLFGDQPSFRWCRTTIDHRIRLWFGRDPIRSITVVRVGRSR